MARMQTKRLKALIVHLEKEGATVRDSGSNGIVVYPRDKSQSPISLSVTTSDHRAWKNARSLIERAGHTYPFSD